MIVSIYQEGINIYVEHNKIDAPWDSIYPGWNNGNNVFYGGEWINATFRDNSGEIISSEYYLTSQVIRQPYLEFASDERYDYSFAGWDVNGDGIADAIPATSTKHIDAMAVVNKTERKYVVTLLDKNGATPLYVYYLPYDSVVTLPTTPTKRGYDFLG